MRPAVWFQPPSKLSEIRISAVQAFAPRIMIAEKPAEGLSVAGMVVPLPISWNGTPS